MKIKDSKIRKDPGGYFFYFYRSFSLWCSSVYNGFFLKIILKLKQVKLGENIRFYGWAHIIRHPLSTIKIGNNCEVRSSFLSNLIGINRPCLIATMRHYASIEIGDHCGLSGAVILAADKITIGNNVLIGANSLITDNDWHNTDPKIRLEECKITIPVRIENNVWLGVNSVVLKGVNIGENTVIAANSIVVKNIPANVIAGGNPCKVLKNIG